MRSCSKTNTKAWEAHVESTKFQFWRFNVTLKKAAKSYYRCWHNLQYVSWLWSALFTTSVGRDPKLKLEEETPMISSIRRFESMIWIPEHWKRRKKFEYWNTIKLFNHSRQRFCVEKIYFKLSLTHTIALWVTDLSIHVFKGTGNTGADTMSRNVWGIPPRSRTRCCKEIHLLIETFPVYSEN